MQFYKSQHGYFPPASSSCGIVVRKKAFPSCHVSVGFSCLGMTESRYQKLFYERPPQMTITYLTLSLSLQII